jgi:hypothetical protein
MINPASPYPSAAMEKPWLLGLLEIVEMEAMQVTCGYSNGPEPLGINWVVISMVKQLVINPASLYPSAAMEIPWLLGLLEIMEMDYILVTCGYSNGPEPPGLNWVVILTEKLQMIIPATLYPSAAMEKP